MARITVASLQSRIAELEAQLAAANARLDKAAEVYRAQRREIASLLIEQRPSRAAPSPVAVRPGAHTPLVQRADGAYWKVQTGWNQWVYRPAFAN